MTPLVAKEGKVLKIERVPGAQLEGTSVQHIAGGPWKGIVINKATATETPDREKADSVRDFTAYIVNTKGKQEEIKEKRQLRFWFKLYVPEYEWEAVTEKFFQDLLNPYEFPKDYIGYVKRVLTLIKEYQEISKMELEMRPPRPGEDDEITMTRRQMVYHTQQTTRTFTTQEDYQRFRDGGGVGPDGSYIQGPSGTSSLRYGASLDRSNRPGFSGQDDQVRQRVGGEPGTPGGFYDYYTPGMISPVSPGGQRFRYYGQDPGSDEFVQFQDGESRFTIRRSQFYSNSVVIKRGLKLNKRGHMIIWIAKKQKLLNTLEDAYPNSLQREDLVRLGGFRKADANRIPVLLRDLQERGMINDMGNGRWLRVQKITAPAEDKAGAQPIPESRTHKVQYVQHLPRLAAKDQPTIAVVTLLYAEKLAVDIMLDYKVTYVRYKTEGEGTVYTIGSIGRHRIVTTKLSRIGYGEDAKTAAGNTVTRLLGTFGQVEYVILVGVGGGVPNFDDSRQDVRIGDIVVSKPGQSRGPLYVACTAVDRDKEGQFNFSTRSWSAREDILERVAQNIMDTQTKDTSRPPGWDTYLKHALDELEGHEIRFYRPPPETDKIYKYLDDGNREEVPHPPELPGSARTYFPDTPVVHHGIVGAGRTLVKYPTVRQAFVTHTGVKVVDSGFQAVMDSIEGNRKDSVMVIRGVSDYYDGTRKKEWQPFASLAAAAYMKEMILKMPTDNDDSD